MRKYYMGIDQGTTGTTVLIFDLDWNCLARGYREHTQYYPQPGWVEHDPVELWEKILEAVREALHKAGITDANEIACIGLDNQGETVVLWDNVTGEPVYPAIVWQDKRTAEMADALKASQGDVFRKKTGLKVDAYFSATKIKWVLENVPGVKERIAMGRIYAGTLDAWMIWKLTGGEAFVTDPSTASRTMLLNIHTGDWDEELLQILDIPREILPRICSTAQVYGKTAPRAFFGASVPISGSACDQQAALFGQACLEPGMVKTTYGTGCFMQMNIGAKPLYSKNGLLLTAGWSIEPGKTTYALEGSVYIAGAAIQWLRDKLQIIQNAAETEKMAKSVRDTGGVFFVPAFSGLAAPYWDQYARGTIVGITGGTTREQIVRATLESIAYQVRDNMDVMIADSGMKIKVMRVDGGACANDFLMQFQSDILGIPLEIPENIETTALGAAYLAAYGVGKLKSLDEVKIRWKLKKRYEPQMDEETRRTLLAKWHEAVRSARDFPCEI